MPRPPTVPAATGAKTKNTTATMAAATTATSRKKVRSWPCDPWARTARARATTNGTAIPRNKTSDGAGTG